jgi:cell division septation protein DedD
MVMLCFFYDLEVPREIIQLLLSGRGMVIAITIVFSCLSFTLGFFVGKYGSQRTPALPAVAQEQTLPMQNIQSNQNSQEGQLQTPPPAETLKGQSEPAGTSVSPLQIPLQAPIQASAKAGESARPATEPSGAGTAREPREPVTTQAKELSKTAAREDSQEVAKQKPDQKPWQKPDLKPEAGETLFAVQLGAFRNKAEADKCRAKYSKKGYKLYIRAEKADKDHRVYKVRTGEFREKKDAELLALKLKKTDNLNAFVVTTTE